MELDESKIAALTNWLIAGAPPQADFCETVAEIGRRLNEAGMGADSVTIFRIPINPLVRGRMTVWTPRGGARRMDHDHDVMKTGYYVGSIAQACYESDRAVRYRVGQQPEFDSNPGSADLIRRNYVDYLLLPLVATHEAKSMIGIGTKRDSGLSQEEEAALRRIAAPLARVCEAEAQREDMHVLLATYLGRDASARVLAGQVRRGEYEVIPAVILFADQVGFTALSNKVAPEEAIGSINRFFSAMDAAICRNGGEVLKLIGDGLLAIYPTPDDLTAQELAAAGAMASIEEARAALSGTGIEFRAALHLGDVHFGNIGSEGRLDFTAIGPTVNLAARILDRADVHGCRAVCTDAFQRLVPGRATHLEDGTLKGFEDKQPVFAVNC